LDETGSAPSHWARLTAVGPHPLRRGAWYRVTVLTNDTVTLEVNGRRVVVSRALTELADHPPGQWTVVPRPPNASLLLPASWGSHYAVCPSCGNRAPLFGAPSSMGCARCGQSFPVAWNEQYMNKSK